MKKEIPHIDQLFKQKLDAQPAHMQSGDWAKAMLLINEEQKKRKFVWWWLGGVGSLALCLFGVIWVVGNSTHDGAKIQGTLEPNSSLIAQNLENGSTVKAFTNSQLSESIKENYVNGEGTYLVENHNQQTRLTQTKTNQIAGIGNNKMDRGQSVFAPISNSQYQTENSPPEDKQASYQAKSTSSVFNIVLPLQSVSNLPSRPEGQFAFNVFTKPLTNIDDDFVPQFHLGMNLESRFNILEPGESFWAGFGIGLLGRYQFSPKWSFDLGAIYEQRTSHDLYSELQEEAIYDFGVATKFYGMHAQTLHQLGLPLLLNRHLGDHIFQIGYIGGYLLGVQGEVEEVTLMPSNSPLRSRKVNEVVESITKGWIDISPFSSWSHRIVSGYQYQVSNGFYAGLRMNYRPGKILADAPKDLQNRPYSKFYLGVNLHLIIE